MTDPATSCAQLQRGLVASAKLAGFELVCAASRSRPWSTSLFEGSRHTCVIGAEASPAFDAWLAGLAELDIAMPRQFIASIDVTEHAGDGRGRDVVTIEVLTVAE